jgi:phage antirepressor YoqD-like protein
MANKQDQKETEMEATTLPSIIIDGDALPVQAHPTLEWLMTTACVARGYSVTARTLRGHRDEHPDELLEGKHWFRPAELVRMSQKGEFPPFDTDGLRQDTVLWSKRGVIRLGFFIRSDRAKRFRDAAEDLIVREAAQAAAGAPDWGAMIPKTLPEALEAYAASLREAKRLECKLLEEAPKVAFFDTVADSDSLLTTTQIAKRLGIGPIMLNSWLQAAGVLYRIHDGTLLPYHRYQAKVGEWFRIVTHTVDVDGKVVTKQRVKWTERGAQWIMQQYRGGRHLATAGGAR